MPERLVDRLDFVSVYFQQSKDSGYGSGTSSFYLCSKA
jgi:hypothetical protein